MYSKRFNDLKTFLWAGTVLSATTFSSIAFGQENQTELTTIQIDADSETATGPVDGYAAGRSSTGSKSDTPIKNIPQSVSVVGREELNDRGVTNKVDEALLYTPGVLAQPYGSDGDTDWIYIRGFEATQSGMFLDGLNLWSYGFGGFQIDPFFLERVEVLKGPASVLYGGANPGGLVNMIGKRPFDEDQIYTEIGINNHGTAFFNLDVNKVFDEQGVSTRFIGKIDGGDTFAGEEFRGVLMPQVTWSPDDATKLNVYAYYSYLDQQTGSNGFLPYYGTVVDARFGRIDPDADYGEPSTDFSYIKQTLIGAEFEHEFDNGWAFSSNARYGHVSRRENSPYPYGYHDSSTGDDYLTEPRGPDDYLTRIGFDHHTTADSFAVDNRLSGEFDAGNAAHEILVGLDYKYYQLDTLQYYPTTDPISADNPVYGGAVVYGTPGTDQTLTQHQIGLYVQDQIRFGDGWIATLNGRYDFLKTELEDRAWAGTAWDGSYDSTDNAVSGRAGLAYEFANGLTPYISAATFFNPVIGITSGEPLRPEEGYQLEGGVKYEPAGFDAVITASVFHIQKENWIDTLNFISTQVGEVTSTGFELEGKAEIAENWKAIAAFTYQEMEITEDGVGTLIGNTPALAPNLTSSLWLDYTVPTGIMEGLSLGAGVRYRGESWANMANTRKVPDVVLVDAAIRYQKDDWGASLNVSNLFDKEYVSGCKSLLTCGYGDSRTITFKLTKTW